MKNLLILGLLVILAACKSEKRYHDGEDVSQIQEIKVNDSVAILSGIKEFQRELNKEFRDPETSPLMDKDRKNFKGLDFFSANPEYYIIAKFERTPNEQPFLMPTTTDRKTEEVKYGIAHFSLNGKSYQLNIYQNLKLMLTEEYIDYLFLPFSDETNGEETYGGGRYIDLKIPEGDTIVIDFNKAYNPYCAYNKKYSCPLVPAENNLSIRIEAGVKKF